MIFLPAFALRRGRGEGGGQHPVGGSQVDSSAHVCCGGWWGGGGVGVAGSHCFACCEDKD